MGNLGRRQDAIERHSFAVEPSHGFIRLHIERLALRGTRKELGSGKACHGRTGSIGGRGHPEQSAILGFDEQRRVTRVTNHDAAGLNGDRQGHCSAQGCDFCISAVKFERVAGCIEGVNVGRKASDGIGA